MRKFGEVMDMFIVLIAVIISWLYTCIKNYQIMSVKCVQFIVHHLYLNKAISLMFKKQIKEYRECSDCRGYSIYFI